MMTLDEVEISVTTTDIADGVPRNAFKCPVALAARRAGIAWAAVAGSSISGLFETYMCTFTLPPEVAQWIADFDKGGYTMMPITFRVKAGP